MIKIYKSFIIVFLLIATTTVQGEESPINMAIKNGDYNLFQNAAASITDWSLKDKEGNNLLIKSLKSLVQFQKKSRAKRAVHYAVLNNDINMLKLLIEKGSDLSVKDENGDTPYTLAIKNRYSDIALFLISLNKPTTESESSDKSVQENQHEKGKLSDYLNIVNYILDKNLPLDEPDQNGKTALHYGVETGIKSLVEKLIARGADVNRKEKSTGLTPLLIATKSGDQEMVTLLIESNARINDGQGSGAEEIISNQHNADSGDNQKEKIKYLKPGDYNLKIIISGSGITSPEKDKRCYYEIFIDNIKVGRTSIGLDSQFKEFTIKLAPNRHLLKISKFSLDEKKGKYVKLNNIYQPRPDFFYMDIIKDRVLEINIKQSIINKDTEYIANFIIDQSGENR